MLILASESPRRIELLGRLNIPFQSIVSGVDESSNRPQEPEELVQALALRKAEAVWCLHPHDVVIGADTIVVQGHHILEKASSTEEAHQMLSLLSGQTHQVMTAVSIVSARHRYSFLSIAEVQFYALREDELQRYLATNEWQGKAGAYAIQGHGALLIERINGDFYTIMGFPIAAVARALEQFREELTHDHSH
jgi:septum formation protein